MDIVTLSGIRRELLFYLEEGPKSLSEIRDRFEITSPEVSPRIKELIEHGLVRFEGRKYRLTPIGKTIVKNFRPFINTVNVFDQYTNFWDEHDVSSIPDDLLYRIGEIKNFVIIEDDSYDMNRTKTEFINIVNQSKSVVGVTCVFDENYIMQLNELFLKNIGVKVVFTKIVFDMLRKNYAQEFDELISNPYATFYLSKDNIKVSQIVTNECLFFSLNYANGKFDLNSNLVSYDSSSINWGMDLFEYYKLRSDKIN